MSTNSVFTVERLKELGAFVSEKPVFREIDWAGAKIPIYVKELGLGGREDLVQAYGMELKGGEKRSGAALILAATVFLDPDGKEPLSLKDAYRLVEPLAAKFMDAVSSVNGGLTNE